MLVVLAYVYLSIVALTSRIRIYSSSEEAIAIFREARPAVYTYWFEHILFLIYYFGRTRTPMLMTPHAKIDRLTKLAHWMNIRVAQGSLEGGGRHALVMLLEQLRAGTSVAIPADGARGPEKKCKAGCIMLAQETGKPIVPVSWKAALQIRIPLRHSKIVIPLPFNSIELRLGEPIAVDRHLQLNELENTKLKISNQLDSLTS